jgi:transposase
VHAVCDALDGRTSVRNPLRLLLTPGHHSDVVQAPALLDGYVPGAVLADKGYDSDALVAQIVAAGAEAVIPWRQGRRQPRAHDANLYADRNKTERFFGRLKQYRRVATRYEKLGQNYLSGVFLASTLISLL